jgi:hypothetical protein
MAFHAQVGRSVRTADALQIASSLFDEGIESFDGKRYTSALTCFEQVGLSPLWPAIALWPHQGHGLADATRGSGM